MGYPWPMPCIVCCFTEMCNFYLSFIIIFCCIKGKYIFYCIFVGQLSDCKWSNPDFINEVLRHPLSCFFFYSWYVTRASYGQHKFNVLSFHDLESVMNRLLLHYLPAYLLDQCSVCLCICSIQSGAWQSSPTHG